MARAKTRPAPKARRTTKTERRPQPPAQPPATRRAAPRDHRDLMIVGVGASAGGLDAFIQLIAALPPDSGLALILVQHLAPAQQSSLPMLLKPHTTMPVIEVIDGVHVEANHVYVIPPNVQLELVGDRLALSPRPGDRTQHTPIDTFFSSLASMAEARGIAVVLSGTASDGALGLRDVKAAGGITFAQKPASAKHDGMPRAAIATGLVDLVLTPAEIGAELGRIARHPYVPSLLFFRDAIGMREDQLRRVFELLRPVSGVDFRHYKLPTIRRRLMRRMALHRLTDIDDYIKFLQSSPAELRGLFEDLLIHVTRFFREPESFEALAREVFPTLVKTRNPDQPLRVWVCGCATGEEAYSVAIRLLEFLHKDHADLRIQIFATDVSDTAIEHARAGIYPATIANDVGAERLRRYFTRSDGHYRVSKAVRDVCVFAKQDLTRDPPFSRIDLVLCRNVLIYMDATLQKKLIGLFHYALSPDGYLMLGQAETVGAQAALFALTDKKHRIHRKKNAPVTLPGISTFPIDYPMPLPRKRAGPDAAASPEATLQGEVNRVILDRFAPAGVVVDNELQIVQFRGQTGPYLEPAPGEASLSLLKMAREGLLYGLRTALHQSRKIKGPVRKAGLRLRVAQGWRPVTIEVVPLMAMGRPHYLVLFEGTGAPEQDAPSRAKRTGGKRKKEDEGTTILRRELAASREYLQSIIQELEAANEELQSANEEILSSNEELQSTNEELDTAKEELQSTNEELNTLNEELLSRNEEMSRVNSDLLNLVASVQIAIVIISSDLRIRRFTPMAERVLNLIPADLDRSIGHINPNIDCPNLEQLIAECIDTVVPCEREVQDRQGKWYLLRIRPYKNHDNKIDGAVLALFDVDQLKKSEYRTRQVETYADAILRGASQPMALLDVELRIRQANGAFAGLINGGLDKITGRQPGEIAGAAWRLDGWRNLAEREIGVTLPPQTINAPRNGSLVVNGHFVPSPDGGAPLILVTVGQENSPGRA
ncbi:MAG TPA: CheR family methyltransferase [Vicinamibacterales bacterium]|nr:CheR family methyltransferase [Vicinamibacterales bacterium]